MRAVSKGGAFGAIATPFKVFLQKSTCSFPIISFKKTSSCYEVVARKPSIYATYYYVL